MENESVESAPSDNLDGSGAAGATTGGALTGNNRSSDDSGCAVETSAVDPTDSRDELEAAETPVAKNLATEYDSAVNFISDLIDQLRDKPQTPSGPDPADNYVDSDLAQRATYVIPDDIPPETPPRTLSPTMLQDGEGADRDAFELADSIADSVSDDLTLEPSFASDPDPDPGAALEDDYSENGRAYRRSMLHNLREAAHLATSASLELNDCDIYARRAYYAGFFGCASAVFSIIFVLMSPRAGTFGFAASVGAFAVATGLGLGFLISFRALTRKAAHVQRRRASAVDAIPPVG